MHKEKNEWAVGTFSSPYTQETPRGVDQLSASRSLAAEYVPYYVAGLRWTRSWSRQLKTQFFVTNGWQRLIFSGVRPSLGLLVQYEKKNWKSFTILSRLFLALRVRLFHRFRRVLCIALDQPCNLAKNFVAFWQNRSKS